MGDSSDNADAETVASAEDETVGRHKPDVRRFGQMILPTKVEYFQPEKGKWRRWIMRLEETFECFGVIKEEQKQRMLSHYMGFEAYNTLCECISPKVPRDLSYKEIVEELTECFDPAPLEIVEIFKFQERRQREDESCDDFLASLRKLAINCNFGCKDCNYLVKALRNQFVVGLRNKAIQKRLLEKHDLTLDLAVDIAKAMETSQKEG